MVFLEAARRVLDAGRDAEFVIAGQGSSHVDLRRRAQVLRIGERVTVAEFPSVGADYWAVLDIYCQPSIAPNAGVTLLQAMAHAVPCIATAAAGLRGLIEPGSSGLIIPPDDPARPGASHHRPARPPGGRRRLGRNARLRVQTSFDPDAEADRLVELYQRSWACPESSSLRHDRGSRPGLLKLDLRASKARAACVATRRILDRLVARLGRRFAMILLHEPQREGRGGGEKSKARSTLLRRHSSCKTCQSREASRVSLLCPSRTIPSIGWRHLKETSRNRRYLPIQLNQTSFLAGAFVSWSG